MRGLLRVVVTFLNYDIIKLMPRIAFPIEFQFIAPARRWLWSITSRDIKNARADDDELV